MGILYTWDHIQDIRLWPHKLGHLVGKDKLTDIHSAWMLYIWDTTEDRSLQAHRGSYKTTAITEMGIIWWLLFHPNDRIGMMRKTFSEAWQIGEAIVNYMALPQVKELFKFVHGHYPKVKKKDRSSGTITFSFKKFITKEGNINVFGVDSGITGTHVDKFIADDVITRQDKNSRAERKRTIDTIQEVRTNILDPDTEFAMLGTPWHRDDAWSVCPKPILFPWNKLTILTEKDMKRKRSTTTKKDIAVNYELKHISAEDAIFKNPIMDRWDWRGTNIVAHLDAKYQGDCTGALTIKATRQDGYSQISGRVFEEHVDEVTDSIIDILEQYRVTIFWMEINADKGYLAQRFREKLRVRKLKIFVQTYSELMNKHVKIIEFLKTEWENIVFDTHPDAAEYLSQILDYEEKEKPDDCADSAASAMRQSSNVYSVGQAMATK